jgi:hypothetical protein
MPNPDGCFVQVWDAPHFSGAADFVNGPRVYASLRDMPGTRRWDNRIRSVKVGPAGSAMIWTDEQFQGTSMRLLTDSEYPRLTDAMDAAIESMQIECVTSSGPTGSVHTTSVLDSPPRGGAISPSPAPLPCASCDR